MGEPTLKEKAWEPSFEEAILASWRAEPDLYAFAPRRGQPIYVIDTPPPYPSGSWHIGAVMAYSMIDMIARAHRMLGRAVLFPFGLDRNGINIERTVEQKTGKPLPRPDRRHDAPGAARGRWRGDGPRRRRAASNPAGQEGARPVVRPRSPDHLAAGREAGVRERRGDDLLLRGHGRHRHVPGPPPRTRQGDRRIRPDDRGRGLPERTQGRRREGEGDRRAARPRGPGEGRGHRTQDADLLAVPQPDRVHFIGRMVPEAARISRGPEAGRAGDGVPAGPAPPAPPRLDR